MGDTGNKLEQVKALKNGKGIQHLLDAAYKIFGNHIAMFNTHYSLQAYTNVVTDDPITNELVISGNFSYETQVLFKEEGFVDAVANTETIAFLISDKVKYDRILGKLYNENHVHVANLVMVACNKPFEDGDAIAFEAVCRMLSKEIAKSEFYQTYGKMYQETYIRKLIDGEIEDRGLYASHIAIVYDGFKSSMRLVAADIGKCDPEYSKLAYFRDLFSQTQRNFKYAIYSHYILIIINSDSNLKFNAKRDLKKLYMLFKDNNIYAGVSNRFDNMYELRKHYLEAVGALNHALKENSNKQVFLHNEIN